MRPPPSCSIAFLENFTRSRYSTCGEKAQTTPCSRLHWSTRPTFDWWAWTRWTGRAGLTSWAWPPERCAASWSITRAKKAQKRGAGITLLSLQDSDGSVDHSDDYDLLSLNEALERLEQASPRQARIIDLRFFGGLSIRETAMALEVSPETVKKDARFALAWLNSQLAP